MSLTPNKQRDGRPYLATGPDDLLESCDVLLKLDGGSELPVHSQVLARCMPVFSGMVVAGGPLSKASVENVLSVPFSDCTLEEANQFLSAIYSYKASKYIDNGSALSIAMLSHKYAMEDMLQMCDDTLAKTAGISSDTSEKFPAYLQDQKPDNFLQIMKSASLFGMPKLLACCEYSIALSALAGSHADLRARCAAEPQLVCSWNRIAEAFCRALKGTRGPMAAEACDMATCNCDCDCCRFCSGCHYSFQQPWKCNNTLSNRALRDLLPSPKEFCKMAECDSTTK